MTEAQAWREIARRFAGRHSDSTHYGLCDAIGCLEMDDFISSTVSMRMEGRVDVYCGKGFAYCIGGADFPYENDRTREARDARCMAALWLALDAEAEE